MTGRALRPVPQTAPRALALIRVSKEREGMVSPELQDTAIGDYCARAGYTITHRMEGLDESGSRARSRWWAKLDAAVAMIEAGDVDVIVVWKFSRTARHRLRWAVALDRVETAGGRLESATEQVDVSTSTGRFTRGMLAELNAFEAERIGEQWKEAHERRLSKGLPSRGGPRFGYVRDGDTYTPDPVTGPLLAGMYADYLEGAGFSTIARRLNRAGQRTLRGGPWSSERVADVLDSGFGAGLLSKGSRRDITWVPGVHPAVIEAAVWEAYREAREARRGQPNAGVPLYPLSGLLRCGDCGSSMHAARLGRYAGYGYICGRWVKTGQGVCVTVSRAKVERVVLQWLARYAAEVEDQATRQAARQAAQLVARSDATDLRRQVLRLDERLNRLTVGWTEGLVPDSAYAATRDELAAKRDELVGRAREAEEMSTALQRPAMPIVTALLDRWDELPAASRREMLGHLLRRVVVVRPESGPVRVEVEPVHALREV
ncbi:recombinase family protein [Geodermatophilus chilensis]|uniref:recombinase family protein n=1 Tax=Geodermatophilus chilensis TaxID=2035835 RepID=UPI0012FFE100|nr:recombinase family protein [Geodermatophilus chilensis]